jgi:hypothetical protein
MFDWMLRLAQRDFLATAGASNLSLSDQAGLAYLISLSSVTARAANREMHTRN